MRHLSAIAFAVRHALSARGISLSTGHAQQLAVAALGHNNLASYQVSGDDSRLQAATDIVIDQERLHARANKFGRDGDTFALALAVVLKERFPDADIYNDHDAWLTDVQSDFERAIVVDDSVNSEVAMTNGTFPRADVELPWWETLDEEYDDALRYDFEGLVKVNQDEERTYWGHEIDVRATLTVERFGRRLFGTRRIGVDYAKLRWLGEPNESFD